MYLGEQKSGRGSQHHYRKRGKSIRSCSTSAYRRGQQTASCRRSASPSSCWQLSRVTFRCLLSCCLPWPSCPLVPYLLLLSFQSSCSFFRLSHSLLSPPSKPFSFPLTPSCPRFGGIWNLGIFMDLLHADTNTLTAGQHLANRAHWLLSRRASLLHVCNVTMFDDKPNYAVIVCQRSGIELTPGWPVWTLTSDSRVSLFFSLLLRRLLDCSSLFSIVSSAAQSQLSSRFSSE